MAMFSFLYLTVAGSQFLFITFRNICLYLFSFKLLLVFLFSFPFTFGRVRNFIHSVYCVLIRNMSVFISHSYS